MLKKTIFDIIDFISKKNLKIEKLNIHSKKHIYNHVCKSHFLIFLFVRISVKFINVYSLLTKRKFFSELKQKDKNVILNYFSNLNLIKQDKLFLLFHALIVLHTDFNEKEKKLKIKQKFSNNQFFENIIIGSGPSGSITGLKLAESGRETLILDKGSSYKNFKLKHPGKEFLKKWEFGGLASSIGNAEIKYASGECFGGGSEINSGLFHKPDKNFLINIKKRFNIKDLNQKKLTNHLNEITKLVQINNLKNQNDKITKLMLRTSKKIRWNYENIPRFLTKNFRKSSMMNTILKRYRFCGGKVALNSKVFEIRYVKNRWCLKILKDKKQYEIYCKNLFLCAGTINTISLIKNNKLVEDKKISDFHFHPMVKVIAKFPKDINSKKFDISSLQINEFFPKFIIGNAASSRAQLKINSFLNDKVYNDININWKKMAIFHATFSLGKGKIYSISKKIDPIVSYNISSKETKKINFGLEKLILYLFKAGCEYVLPIINENKVLFKNSYKFKEIKNPKEFNLSTVHLLGGCPFGENSSITIANSYGKVHNQKNLYINDGSLICGDLVKNPQGIIMALAYRNVDNFINNDEKEK